MCARAQAADVVLAMDASGSISQGDWIKFKNFTHNLVYYLPIEPEKMHLGMVEFNTGAKLVTSLESSKDKINAHLTNDLSQSPDGNTQCVPVVLYPCSAVPISTACLARMLEYCAHYCRQYSIKSVEACTCTHIQAHVCTYTHIHTLAPHMNARSTGEAVRLGVKDLVENGRGGNIPKILLVLTDGLPNNAQLGGSAAAGPSAGQAAADAAFAEAKTAGVAVQLVTVGFLISYMPINPEWSADGFPPIKLALGYQELLDRIQTVVDRISEMTCVRSTKAPTELPSPTPTLDPTMELHTPPSKPFTFPPTKTPSETPTEPPTVFHIHRVLQRSIFL